MNKLIYVLLKKDKEQKKKKQLDFNFLLSFHSSFIIHVSLSLSPSSADYTYKKMVYVYTNWWFMGRKKNVFCCLTAVSGQPQADVDLDFIKANRDGVCLS